MDVLRHFDAPAFSLEPAARATGPFPRRPLLETWWRHRSAPDEVPEIVAGEHAVLPLRRDAAGHLSFLGEEDLVDYHAPLGGGASELVAGYFDGLPAGTRFRLDSLPGEAAAVIAAGLATAGVASTPVRHEVTAVLDLPDDPGAYYAGLSGKERHELRRKQRRCADLAGEPRLVSSIGDEAFDHFVGLHRRASGPKGSFLDGAMAAFFADLRAVPGARVDLLYGDGPEPLAAAFGFEDQDGYYLYNSGFDPDQAAASPGVVLTAALIEDAITRGLARFDFLKGDEPYKFRLGARPRPLFVLEGDR